MHTRQRGAHRTLLLTFPGHIIKAHDLSSSSHRNSLGFQWSATLFLSSSFTFPLDLSPPCRIAREHRCCRRSSARCAYPAPRDLYIPARQNSDTGTLLAGRRVCRDPHELHLLWSLKFHLLSYYCSWMTQERRRRACLVLIPSVSHLLVAVPTEQYLRHYHPG